MRAGEIAGLEDARRYLAEEHGIRYAGIQGISELFGRRQVKLKEQPGKDLVLFGGAGIASTFMQLDLIDEY